MSDPSLVPRNALDGVEVGLSVSDSADLRRLGLNERHAELAIGEITRAVLIAGGRITYGGRMKPSGFTQQLMNEVRRYGTTRQSLRICLALPEHRKLTLEELDEIDRQLGLWGELTALDGDGNSVSWRNPATASLGGDERTAYSALRRFMTSVTQARVLLGGQLGTTVKGAMPGVIEEAILAIGAGQPIYLAGGFGGAAAAAAMTLELDDFAWLPSGLPSKADDPVAGVSLDALRAAASSGSWSVEGNGLTREQNRMLATSHRPGEIASLVALGLAKAFDGSR